MNIITFIASRSVGGYGSNAPIDFMVMFYFLLITLYTITFVIGIAEVSLDGMKVKKYDRVWKLIFFTYAIGVIIGQILFIEIGKKK
jgi:hypothetical protein